MPYFENLTRAIQDYNNNIERYYSNPSDDLVGAVCTADFEMAKALLRDDEHFAVKVAKMILAHKEISDIKIKIE